MFALYVPTPDELLRSAAWLLWPITLMACLLAWRSGRPSSDSRLGLCVTWSVFVAFLSYWWFHQIRRVWTFHHNTQDGLSDVLALLCGQHAAAIAAVAIIAFREKILIWSTTPRGVAKCELNPYQTPTTSQSPPTKANGLQAHSDFLRNVTSWAVCLIIYCIIDVFYVHSGPGSVRWAEMLLGPGFPGAMLYANRGLFPSIENWFTRWFCIAVVSAGIAVVSGFMLITLGIWFHLSIGGSL